MSDTTHPTPTPGNTDARQIAEFLCDEAWAGRWNPCPDPNTRPIAEEVARVLAPWIAALRSPAWHTPEVERARLKAAALMEECGDASAEGFRAEVTATLDDLACIAAGLAALAPTEPGAEGQRVRLLEEALREVRGYAYQIAFPLEGGPEREALAGNIVGAVDDALSGAPTETGTPTVAGEAEWRGVYVASRTRHAAAWRTLRDEAGYPIVSTWIDEAGSGQTLDRAEFWTRVIREVQGAQALVLFRHADDVPDGALVEVGAALAAGVPVFAVGEYKDSGFRNHPLVRACLTVEGAIRTALASTSPTSLQGDRTPGTASVSVECPPKMQPKIRDFAPDSPGAEGARALDAFNVGFDLGRSCAVQRHQDGRDWARTLVSVGFAAHPAWAQAAYRAAHAEIGYATADAAAFTIKRELLCALSAGRAISGCAIPLTDAQRESMTAPNVRHLPGLSSGEHTDLCAMRALTGEWSCAPDCPSSGVAPTGETERLIRNNGVLALWETEEGFAYAWNRIPAEDEGADAGDFETVADLLAGLRAPTPSGEAPAPEPDVDDECSSCGEESPKGECVNSRRPCGHHCTHSLPHDSCCWCGKEFGEAPAGAGEQGDAVRRCRFCEAGDEAFNGCHYDKYACEIEFPELWPEPYNGPRPSTGETEVGHG